MAEKPANITDLNSLSDEELALLVRKSNETAFSKLVERHENRVFSLALRMVARSEEARDIAQEVFLSFWQDPAAFRPTARFTTWLYRVTTNRAISHLRVRSVKRLLFFSDYDPTESAESSDERADDRIVREDRDETIEREILHLPPRQRAAVHLRYKEGMSVADVAKSLGVSRKSAESLLFRAKETLRERLHSE